MSAPAAIAEHPEPVWLPVDVRRDRDPRCLGASMAAIEAVLGAQDAVETSCVSRRGGPAHDIAGKGSGEATDWVKRLAAALASGRDHEIADAGAALAGRGAGSTPAGDDVLVGALYAVRLVLPEPVAERIGATIAAAAAPRTTTTSARWLCRAARGEAIAEWRSLLEAVAAGEAVEIGARALAVRRLGHSSGRAALAGFVGATRALLGGLR